VKFTNCLYPLPLRLALGFGQSLELGLGLRIRVRAMAKFILGMSGLGSKLTVNRIQLRPVSGNVCETWITICHGYCEVLYATYRLCLMYVCSCLL